MSVAAVPYQIGFILLRGFTMLSVAGVIEVLRMANYLGQRELYAWHVYADEADICASNGLTLVANASRSDLLACDVVFVCGGIQVQAAATGSVKQLLQELAASKRVVLGGLCTGAVALASAKLLDGYRSAVHWEALPAVREAFSRVQFTEALYVLDRDRYTSGGGTASMDMMLQLVRRQYGKNLAASVSQQFVMEKIREADNTPHRVPDEQIGPGYEYVQTAIELMQANFDEVLSIQEIAQLVGLSPRQVERLFKRYFSVSPAQYYLRLRLQRAKELLSQTSMTVMQITVACGFSTPSHFSKAYRAYYGHTPREQRKPLDPDLTYKVAGSAGVIAKGG